jgi:hypothetical protein
VDLLEDSGHLEGKPLLRIGGMDVGEDGRWMVQMPVRSGLREWL